MNSGLGTDRQSVARHAAASAVSPALELPLWLAVALLPVALGPVAAVVTQVGPAAFARRRYARLGLRRPRLYLDAPVGPWLRPRHRLRLLR